MNRSRFMVSLLWRSIAKCILLFKVSDFLNFNVCYTQPMNKPMHQISAEDVAALYSKLAEYRIEAWVDGGWGIDALLGEQT